MAKTSDRHLLKRPTSQPEYQAELLQRRLEVGDMLKRRIPQAEMARRLQVDQGTISRDVKAILKLWANELAGKAATLRAREAYTLDHLELMAQLNMENALAKRQALDEAKDGGKISQAWERYDRSARAWFEERIRIQERRAKLLNLDAQVLQTNVAVQVPISFIQMKPVEAKAQIASGDVIEGEVVADGGDD